MSNTDKQLTQEQLSEILDLHWKWVRGEPGGVQANLRYANLEGANLTGANLYRANLEGANLTGANLTNAILTGANLRYAILTGANLTGANLEEANLRDANLEGAGLEEANLTEANLEGADLEGAKLPPPSLDLSGCTVGYKKVWNSDRSKLVVIELRFPEGSELVSTVIGRKCRASEAVVVRCVSTGHKEETEFRSMHDRSFVYRIGETAWPDGRFNDSIAVECTSGIHFFTTQGEAEDYQF